MMLANNSSSLVANSAAGNTHDGGGSGSGSGDGGSIPGGGFSDEDKARMEVGDSGGGGGNRWPRQETLELLRIRSEMEVTFRDSNLKGPLWEEVSRKMSQLGYRRSAKKCKEKFENVYKYHKRTKDGRASKSDGKTYRFFEQLEALEKNAPSLPSPQPQQPRLLQIQARPQLQPQTQAQPQSLSQTPMPATIMAPLPVTVAPSNTNVTSIPTHVTVASAPAAVPVSFSPNLNNNPLFSTLPFASHMPSAAAAAAGAADSAMNNPIHPQGNAFQSSHPNVSLSLPSDEFTSSSTSSDEDIRTRHKRKRKLKDFFEGLLQNMMEKQEQLHKNFLEALEKRERDRMIREEAWRVQEMARMNRELDLLNQERSMAAAKDAAVTALLQKFTAQENQQKQQVPPSTNNAPQIQLSLPKQNTQPPPHPHPHPQEITLTPTPAQPLAPVSAAAAPPPPPPATAEAYGLALAIRHEANNNGGESFMTPSPSRWPKTEVEALIKLRSNMDMKYQDNCPKGPLWEEISAQMTKLGYNRSSKRCKEKWENINKYFKKVKESNKRRHEDSKTCPYFHQLDALYKEKAKADANSFHISYANPIKTDQAPLAIMARPEQQWPVPIQESGTGMDEDDELDSENYDENDDEEEDEEGSHEMVTNKQQTTVSVPTTTATAV